MDDGFTVLTNYERLLQRRCSFSPSKREWGEVAERFSPDDDGKNQRARTHEPFVDQIQEERDDSQSKTNILASKTSKLMQ